jgi:hypothetical protein
MSWMTVTEVELWEDGLIGVAAWWPFDPDSGAPDLRPLIPPKRYTEFEYLRMLHKLLPPGRIWEFPTDDGGG